MLKSSSSSGNFSNVTYSGKLTGKNNGDISVSGTTYSSPCAEIGSASATTASQFIQTTIYPGIPAYNAGIGFSGGGIVSASVINKLRSFGIYSAGFTSSMQITTTNGTSEFVRVNFNGDGNVEAGSDNTQSMGTSGKRWSVIYAGTGTINTSDRATKTDIEDLSETEKSVAVAIKSLFKKYKFKDAVEAKGDGARIHFGVIAQDVAAAFEAEGLDANRYALFCSDTWWEKEVTEVDVDGNSITRLAIVDANEPDAIKKTRLGIRYDELLAFVIASI